MKTLNVIFIGNYSYPQGMAATKRIRHFAEYLVARQINTKVMLLRKSGSSHAVSDTKGICNNVYYESIGNKVDINKSLINFIYTSSLYLVKGASKLWHWKVVEAKNILYCYNGLSIENVFFVLAAKLFGYYIVFDIVEDHVLTQEKLHVLAKLKLYSVKSLEKHINKFANAIIVISYYLKEKFERNAQNNIPIKLIPISAICLDSTADTPPRNTIKIVYTGSFAKKDGVDSLLAAYGDLRKLHRNCILLLAGKGENFSKIQELVAEKEGVSYLGYLDDTDFYKLLKDADILCATRTGSDYANAGFPFKLGEYLATGNPVVTSDVSDVSYYLQHMKDAIIVEPDNVGEIRRALEFCINHPEEAKAIGANGRRKCRKYFNPQINGQSLLELFHTLT